MKIIYGYKMRDLEPHEPHYGPSPIIKHFSYSHLPERLQEVSAPICELALEFDLKIKDSPEKSAGLRKLLEAKDCLVRAYKE